VGPISRSSLGAGQLAAARGVRGLAPAFYDSLPHQPGHAAAGPARTRRAAFSYDREEQRDKEHPTRVATSIPKKTPVPIEWRLAATSPLDVNKRRHTKDEGERRS